MIRRLPLLGRCLDSRTGDQKSMNNLNAPAQTATANGGSVQRLVMRLRKQADDLEIMEHLKPYATDCRAAAGRLERLESHFREIEKLYNQGCIELVDETADDQAMFEAVLEDGCGYGQHNAQAHAARKE